MKPQSAFIVFIIVTNLILLTAFFIFTIFEKLQKEKVSASLKNVCESEPCVNFCKKLSSDEKSDFYSSFLTDLNSEKWNDFNGFSCDKDKMDVLNLQQWNVTIMLVREMSLCVHENAERT